MQKKGVTQVLGLVLAVIVAILISLIGYIVYKSLYDAPKEEIEIEKECSLDVKLCKDGSYVYRNSSLNCDFDLCLVKEILNKTE